MRRNKTPNPSVHLNQVAVISIEEQRQQAAVNLLNFAGVRIIRRGPSFALVVHPAMDDHYLRDAVRILGMAHLPILYPGGRDA